MYAAPTAVYVGVFFVIPLLLVARMSLGNWTLLGGDRGLNFPNNFTALTKNTLFGPAVQIYTPMHPFDAELRRKVESGKPVEIGADVWVGGGAIILPGVRIGARAVIGAGSVVTRDVPEGVFAAGNPCGVVREIAGSVEGDA